MLIFSLLISDRCSTLGALPASISKLVLLVIGQYSCLGRQLNELKKSSQDGGPCRSAGSIVNHHSEEVQLPAHGRITYYYSGC